MMDINKEWKNVEQGKDEDLSALLEMSLIGKLPSKDPMEKVRFAILMNACWGLLLGAGYLYVLLKFSFWQIILCVGAILLVTLWTVTQTLLLYRKLPRHMNTHTVLQEMEGHYNNIRKWMNLQLWAGLLIYPVCVAGGFMLGGCLGSGEPIGIFMQKPKMILILLITVVVLAPICFYLAKWMSHKAFGQYALELKKNIEALKNEK